MQRDEQDPLIGRTVAGKYLIESFVGSGAMGAVYRAKQTNLDKTIAIKVLHGEHASDKSFAGRFNREAKAASRLNHPNSMAVLDYGEEPDGLLYIAMEFIDGRSLQQVLREDWPLPPVRIANILMQTLAALAVAHDAGVVHRDLKPENIMMLRGTDDDGLPTDIVKVCDFGIAKIVESRAYAGENRDSGGHVTTAGFLVGTPEYMSPEQGRGESLDARSDLYSLGVILYQLLTGRVPFEAESAVGVVLKHVTVIPDRPSAINPWVDKALESICLRALEKNRDVRYQTAREMRGELRSVVGLPRGVASSPQLPSDVSTTRVLAPSAGETSGHARTISTLDAAEVARVAVPARLAKRSGRRRNTLAVVAISTLFLGVAAAASVIVVFRGRGQSSGKTPNSASGSAPFAFLVPDSPSSKDVPLPPLAPADDSSGSRTSPIASNASKGKPSPSASAAPVVHDGGGGLVIAVPSASAAPTVSSVPSATAPASTSASPLPTAPPEPFEVGKAYVVIGLVNARGVTESQVRQAVRTINLSGCYQAALRVHGSRMTGVAMLSLSISEQGATVGMVSGSLALPDAKRCIQGQASGLRFQKVEAGGATADVQLDFKMP